MVAVTLAVAVALVAAVTSAGVVVSMAARSAVAYPCQAELVPAEAASVLAECAVEVVLSRAGLFRHTHPDVLGIALWLPWIYVGASVGLGNVGRFLAETR